MNSKAVRRIIGMGLIAALAAGAGAIWAALPSQNPGGATLHQATVEAWSATAQRNLGVELQIAAGFEAGVDSTASSGATVWLGYLEPATPQGPSRAARVWLEIE